MSKGPVTTHEEIEAYARQLQAQKASQKDPDGDESGSGVPLSMMESWIRPFMAQLKTDSRITLIP